MNGMLNRQVAVIALAVGLASMLGVGASLAQRGGEAPAEPQPEIVYTPLYRATGVRDSASIATAITCTNLGALEADIMVQITDFDGAADCTLTRNDLPINQSMTVATRDTAAYVEDSWCAVAPGTEQGSLVISALPSGSLQLICTVQILDPTAVTPEFATILDLYKQ